MDNQPWDLVVVGGGTAGLVGAKTAASLGARVVMIERENPGGDCLWTGCVPSKALLAAGAAAATARDSAAFGVTTSDVRVDFAAVMKHVHEAIAHIAPVDSFEATEDTGVNVIQGEAIFTSPTTLEVNGETITFSQALLAMGATPAMPPIPGLAEADYLTSETLWGLTELPDDLVILGGGSIGSELGQAFARLGAKVTIVEGAPRIMPREDEDAGALVASALEADGVTLMTGQNVSAVEGRELVLEDGARVPFGTLLVAVGRSPRTTGFGLDKLGVEILKGGFVDVDEHLRSKANPKVWAAGDLSGYPQFTHTASSHGSLAASNAILGVPRKVDTSAIPRVTFTHPEVAAVGVATNPAPEGIQISTVQHSHTDRATAEGEPDGFARLAMDSSGKIVGATIVGPRAGESLGEITLAVAKGLKTRDLAGVIHPYPTYNDAPWNAALADARKTLDKPVVKKATSIVTDLRRRWVNRD